MSIRAIALVAEDQGHFRAVTALFDASAREGRTRFDDQDLDWHREWQGLDVSEQWYKYDPEDARDLRPFVNANGRSIPPLGLINGKPLQPEASMWRRVLILMSQRHPCPDVVLLTRDLDGQSARLAGLEQIRNGFDWPFAVVVAAPQPEVEAWHVSGFEPETDAERAVLDALTKKLSFEPTTQSHRLTSRPNHADTDAKRVLAELCGDDPDREMDCLTDRNLLAARGAHNGAKPFLDELVPVLTQLFGAAR